MTQEFGLGELYKQFPAESLDTRLQNHCGRGWRRIKKKKKLFLEGQKNISNPVFPRVKPSLMSLHCTLRVDRQSPGTCPRILQRGWDRLRGREVEKQDSKSHSKLGTHFWFLNRVRGREDLSFFPLKTESSRSVKRFIKIFDLVA